MHWEVQRAVEKLFIWFQHLPGNATVQPVLGQEHPADTCRQRSVELGPSPQCSQTLQSHPTAGWGGEGLAWSPKGLNKCLTSSTGRIALESSFDLLMRSVWPGTVPSWPHKCASCIPSQGHSHFSCQFGLHYMSLHISASPGAGSGTSVIAHLMLFTKSWIPVNIGGMWQGKQGLSSSFTLLLTKFHSSGLGAVGTPCVRSNQSAKGDEAGPGTCQQPICWKLMIQSCMGNLYEWKKRQPVIGIGGWSVSKQKKGILWWQW